jgi:hypothetical protein
LRGVRRGPASPDAISFEAMLKFATPGRVLAAVGYARNRMAIGL